MPFLLVYIPSAANGVPSGSTQTFPAGSTLANVAMNGNVIWYSSATGGGRNVASILPLSTVLVNGASYFAAQVVNGQESQDRYELVVAISALANEKFSFKNLSYSPNPVSNILNVSNNSIISSIEITSLLGQSVMYKKTNSLQSEIDLTNLSKGIYIMKVSSEGSEKTVKIVKD